jgi:hypothetical protein
LQKEVGNNGWTRKNKTRGNGIARVMKSVGGPADMSEAHEGMESKAEEAKEYAMEEKRLQRN